MADPWATQQGIKRLPYLKPTPPDQVLRMMMHTLFAEHLHQLRTYASQTIDTELIEGRKVLWRQGLGCAQDLLDWMTLMALDDLNHFLPSKSDPQGHGV